MFKAVIVLLFLAQLSVKPTVAKVIDAKKLDSLFRALDNNNESMGSVAIFKNGKPLYEHAIGFRSVNNEDKLPATTATKYRVASITKMYTATLIFQLIDENKLSLATTIDTWFPDIPNASAITIRQLLCHRSGIHNFITTDTWAMGRKTEQELLSIIARSPVDFPPGTKSAYSNTNYWLLGYIAERICKKAFAELLNERIVTPLGLKDTYYGDTTDLRKNESHSYYFSDGKWMQYPEIDMSLLSGAGAVIATPADVCRFMTCLFAGKLISAQSLEQMISSKEEAGLGLNKVPFYTHNGYGHTGHIDGFFSTACYFPADSLAITYCSNGHRYELNEILVGVLSIYYGRPYDIPDFKAAIANAENLEKYTGTYSSEKFPLKITISAVGERLQAQATGQVAFPLKSVATGKYEFAGAGIEIEFHTDKNEMIFKQLGHTYLFVKDRD